MKSVILWGIALLFWIFTCYQLASFYQENDILLAFNLSTSAKILIVATLVTASSISFTLFNIFTRKWQVAIPALAALSLLPIIFIPIPLSLFFASATMMALALNFRAIGNQLSSYINFQPDKIFTSAIKSLARLLVLIIAFSYFLNTTARIKEKEFIVPDALIDLAIKFVPQSQNINQDINLGQLGIANLENLQKLKADPSLAKQLGIDQKLLDTLNASPSPIVLQNPFREFIKIQFQTVIKPFLSYIPAILAILFFFTMDFFLSLTSILPGPVLWLVFYILKRFELIEFEEETRSVKKLVV